MVYLDEADKDAELAALKAAGKARDPNWAPWRDSAYTERLFREFRKQQHDECEFVDRAVEGYHDLLAALDKCQKALAMMINPDCIAQTTVLSAFATATEAEAAARTAISKHGGA